MHVAVVIVVVLLLTSSYASITPKSPIARARGEARALNRAVIAAVLAGRQRVLAQDIPITGDLVIPMEWYYPYPYHYSYLYLYLYHDPYHYQV